MPLVLGEGRVVKTAQEAVKIQAGELHARVPLCGATVSAWVPGITDRQTLLTVREK